MPNPSGSGLLAWAPSAGMAPLPPSRAVRLPEQSPVLCIAPSQVVNTSQRSFRPKLMPHDAPSPPARTSTLGTDRALGNAVDLERVDRLARERRRGDGRRHGTDRAAVGADRLRVDHRAGEDSIGELRGLLGRRLRAAARGDLLQRHAGNADREEGGEEQLHVPAETRRRSHGLHRAHGPIIRP